MAVRWDSHIAEKYNRIKGRRGSGKAIVAVAREMAVAMYHMLTRREPYRFSGEAFVNRKLKRLEYKSRFGSSKTKETPLGVASR